MSAGDVSAAPTRFAARTVAATLRAGGLVGTVVVLAGLAVAIAQDAGAWAHGPRGRVLGTGAALRLGDLPHQLAAGHGTGIATLGLLVLAATPAAGVAAAGLVWARARRWRVAGVAAVVLALLVVASLLGAGG